MAESANREDVFRHGSVVTSSYSGKKIIRFVHSSAVDAAQIRIKELMTSEIRSVLGTIKTPRLV
nr:MAG: hypothetical protein EDM05_18615 [Leptolyngbya sp. IPPAS B-1204]